MSERPTTAGGIPAWGLCAGCRHARTVTTRTSAFSLCERSRIDPRFPRYPPLPVVACAGFEPPGDAAGQRSAGGA